MTAQLLDDRYAPITSEIGFLDCDAETAKTAYIDWQSPIQSQRGVSLECHEVHGSFVSKLNSLLPLTSVERRRSLFLPTASRWIAYFDNGLRGTDSFSVVSYLAQVIRCQGIRAVSVPDTVRKTTAGSHGRYGATIFEVYSPTPVRGSSLNTQRSVFAVNDGGRWKYGAEGDPFDFEDLMQYDARRIPERFTLEMLAKYLGNFGIDFVSTAYYEVAQPAFLVAKKGPSAVGVAEYSLDEASISF